MLLEVIAEIHRASRRTYGARRIHAELVHGRGLQVARCTVELVMRRNNLAGLPGRHRYRKIPNLATATDLVDRRFRRSGPQRVVGHRHRAPRGVLEPGGGERTSPLARRSELVEAEGSRTRGTPGRVEAALTTTGRASTVRWCGSG